MSGWESPSNASGHEESSVRGRAFSRCTHGNPLCSTSMLHFETLVSVQQCACAEPYSVRSAQKQLQRFSRFVILDSCNIIESSFHLVQNLQLIHSAAAAATARILAETKKVHDISSPELTLASTVSWNRQ